MKHGQQHGTERHAVEQRAGNGEEHGVRSCPTRAGAQPQQEQTREHRQRIEQIQRGSADSAAFRARRAQRVEHQPEREAQHQRQPCEHRLILYRGPHPKSFAQKPSPRCGVSAY